jgi:hypothetical protein
MEGIRPTGTWWPERLREGVRRAKEHGDRKRVSSRKRVSLIKA